MNLLSAPHHCIYNLSTSFLENSNTILTNDIGSRLNLLIMISKFNFCYVHLCIKDNVTMTIVQIKVPFEK